MEKVAWALLDVGFGSPMKDVLEEEVNEAFIATAVAGDEFWHISTSLITSQVNNLFRFLQHLV